MFLEPSRYTHKTWREARWVAGQADEAEDGWKYLQDKGGATTDKTVAEKRKEALKAAGFSGETKRGWSDVKMWAQLEGQELKREGQKVEVADASSERTLKTFNLREVDYGQSGYMTQADREYHTKHLEGALHDLSEMLGVDPTALSFSGRLGIAMGARGTGFVGGAAKAHYEGGKHVINLTKFKGGGSMAHEWGHALDNILAEHYVETAHKDADFWITESYDRKGFPGLVREAYKDVLTAMSTHPDPESVKKKIKEYLDGKYEERNAEVEKSNALVEEINEIRRKPRDEELRAKQNEYSKRNIARWEEELKGLEEKANKKTKAGKPAPGSGKAEIEAGHRRWWIKKEQEKMAARNAQELRTPQDEEKIKEIEQKVEGYRLAINQMDRHIKETEDLDPTVSDFWRSAVMLGGNYSDIREKFARSFESYIQDELRAQGRKSDYLTGGAKTESQYLTFIPLPTGGFAQPYAHGEERRRINAAMKRFLEVLKAEKALEKAMESFARFVILQ
jgi:hypothetical protein